VEALTRDHLDKRLAEVESTLIKWVVGTGVVVILSIVGTAIAAVNFLAAHYRP
jgi:hypothetical protein